MLSAIHVPELFMFSPTIILSNLGARDRTLFLRCALVYSSRRARFLWTILTHLGGATFTVLAATIPAVAQQALVTLLLSHLLVQLVKRTVGRPRPSRGIAGAALIVEPDRFSFPSGHAAAAMSVAFVYASAYPSLALFLVALAGAVGISRVFLGVHYPGDVLIGQIIALVTGLVALHGWR